MGKVCIITASQSIENRLLEMISILIDAEIDIESAILPMDCTPQYLRDCVVEANADVYIVGSSMANTLSCYVKAHTNAIVIGLPISGDNSDINNAIFHINGLPTGMPHSIAAVDSIMDVGKTAKRLIAEKAS